MLFPLGHRSRSLLCWAVVPLGEGEPIFFCCVRHAGRRFFGWMGWGNCFQVSEWRDRIIQKLLIIPQQLHNLKILFIDSIEMHPIYEIQLNPCIHSNVKATWQQCRVYSIKTVPKRGLHNVMCGLFCHTCRLAHDVSCIAFSWRGC